MKGLVVTEDNKLYLEEKLPIPEIGEYEALVKNECCMICNGTDLGVIGGKVREVTRYPAVLGHEDAGRVVKIGKKVTSFKVGDLVARERQHEQRDDTEQQQQEPGRKVGASPDEVEPDEKCGDRGEGPPRDAAAAAVEAVFEFRSGHLPVGQSV